MTELRHCSQLNPEFTHRPAALMLRPPVEVVPAACPNHLLPVQLPHRRGGEHGEALRVREADADVDDGTDGLVVPAGVATAAAGRLAGHPDDEGETPRERRVAGDATAGAAAAAAAATTSPGVQRRGRAARRQNLQGRAFECKGPDVERALLTLEQTRLRTSSLRRGLLALLPTPTPPQLSEEPVEALAMELTSRPPPPMLLLVWSPAAGVPVAPDEERQEPECSDCRPPRPRSRTESSGALSGPRRSSGRRRRSMAIASDWLYIQGDSQLVCFLNHPLFL